MPDGVPPSSHWAGEGGAGAGDGLPTWLLVVGAGRPRRRPQLRCSRPAEGEEGSANRYVCDKGPLAYSFGTNPAILGLSWKNIAQRTASTGGPQMSEVIILPSLFVSVLLLCGLQMSMLRSYCIYSLSVVLQEEGQPPLQSPARSLCPHPYSKHWPSSPADPVSCTGTKG